MNTGDIASFYITTAIDYPNSIPHMGHAYEKVVADFYARCARLRGQPTWFLIGLDEHGQKIQEAAEEAGRSPKEFVDARAVTFRELYRFLAISNDDFIRTSEPRHHRFARRLYEQVRDRGDIYKGIYRAHYCVDCERPLQKSELTAGRCPIHPGRELEEVEEESYFFRLGKYRDGVRAYIEEHPEFIVPEERRNEILSRLREEVHDLSISRSTFSWGIPLPDDPDHVLYVWIDALSNYLSALSEPDPARQGFWPAACHVIGKDILWFHTVIWPAILLSAGFPLPRQVYAHGFILDKDGRKMAKSLGNVVDPLEVAREYSVDVLRFYFLRAFSSGQDGRFSLEELEDRYQNELGNDLGNLVLRLLKLGISRAGGRIDPVPEADDLGVRECAEEYFGFADARQHHRAVESLWSLIRRTNGYLNHQAPWEIQDPQEVRRVLCGPSEAMHWILHLLEPVMPGVAAAAARSFGVELGPLEALRAGRHAYTLQPAAPLFPRREARRSSGQPSPAPAGAGPESREPAPRPEPADPFAKLEIRVGRVVAVRDHPQADTLYALTVDLGGEERTICAGLRAHVPAGELEGKLVPVVANLKPAVLRGVESRGMVLAAERADGTFTPVRAEGARPGDLVTVEGIDPRPKKRLSKRDFDKVALRVAGRRVTWGGKPLRSASGGELLCEAEDGAEVR